MPRAAVAWSRSAANAAIPSSTPSQAVRGVHSLPDALMTFSRSRQMERQSDERTFKDPVCGMEVSRVTAIAEFVYQGKTFYFCAGTCRQAFEEEPEKYIKPHRQHGLKPG
jgi:YHS domain-containing protein